MIRIPLIFSPILMIPLLNPQFCLPGFPILLVNGASGIAVGMATNMPPHNLSEIIDATIAFIDNKDITTDEILGLY